MAYFSQIIADEKNMRAKEIRAAVDGTTQITYVCSALPGSALSEPVWQIQRVSAAADGSVSIKFAGGSNEYNQIMNNYLTSSFFQQTSDLTYLIFLFLT